MSSCVCVRCIRGFVHETKEVAALPMLGAAAEKVLPPPDPHMWGLRQVQFQSLRSSVAKGASGPLIFSIIFCLKIQKIVVCKTNYTT